MLGEENEANNASRACSKSQQKRYEISGLGAALVLGLASLTAHPSSAQSVIVTVRLDKPSVAPGEQTTLRVLAQVAPALRPRSQQLFSWHIDLVQESVAVADLTIASLDRPASDRVSTTSSSGNVDGNTVRGIFDTLAGRPTAGVLEPVELLTVPVVGRRAGTATFRVNAGTGPAGLSGDFLVAGLNPDETWSGGDYAIATATIEVKAADPEPPTLAISIDRSIGGPAGTVVLGFPVVTFRTYLVEFTETLGPEPPWQPLPDAPHNSGRVTDPVAAGPRFYRLLSNGD